MDVHRAGTVGSPNAHCDERKLATAGPPNGRRHVHITSSSCRTRDEQEARRERLWMTTQRNTGAGSVSRRLKPDLADSLAATAGWQAAEESMRRTHEEDSEETRTASASLVVSTPG